MKGRRLIIVFSLLILIALVLRKTGIYAGSVLLIISVSSLSLVILFTTEIFRTILARVVLTASVLAALAILQYWLTSDYIIIPTLVAYFIFMILAFKYVQHKPSGMIVFIPVFLILLLTVVLNPRQFHNLFKSTSYEDYVLTKYRQDQGLMADFLINRYKEIDIEKSNKYLKDALTEDSLKNSKKALEYFNKSIENNPDNAFAYHRRGFLKLTRLELDPMNVVSALKDFSRAIRLDSKFAEAYYHRSMTYFYLGNKNNAFLDRLKVLQIDSIMPDSAFMAKYGCSKKSLSVPPDS